MTTVAALVILFAFFVLEGRLRQGADARSLETGAADRGTTRLIGAAFALAILLVLVSPLLGAAGIATLPGPIGWAGVALMLVALVGRVWAAQVLGTAYTRTLRTVAGQRVVRAGPYRLIRHPGYAADILLWLGAGLATMNWLALAIILVVIVAVYVRRIAAEERMLLEAFGDDYRDYARQTRRILPLLY